MRYGRGFYRVAFEPSHSILYNRARLVVGLPPPVNDKPCASDEDYKWLIGTHHRDFYDHQIY